MISKSFITFQKEAPQEQQAWAEMIQSLSKVSSLDNKTQSLCYISALVGANLYSGLSFHVKAAKQLGISKEDVKSAVLMNLSLCGNRVIKALQIALEAYDE